MSRFPAAIAVIALTLGLLAAVPSGAAQSDAPADCAEVFCAGAASIDMTWHTGSGQGQLGSGRNADPTKFDPFHHSVKMVPTDGAQSRTFAKALVLRGSDGRKVAYVKTELYLQQDLMTRRVVELVTGTDPLSDLAVDGLDPDGIMLGGTHNHSAPHHTSTAWGVWVFADSFDFRAFEHTARKIAESIKEADDALQPARVGASVTRVSDVQQNILGPANADDGSPAGFPRDHFDPELAVVRVDALSGDPIGAIVNFAMHPESISGANLISGDFIGIVERDVERALGREPGAADGPVVAWSQGGLGDVEPDDLRASPAEDGRAYWRRDFAQAERMSARLTAEVLRTWDDVAAGTPDVAEKFVPFTDDPIVDAIAYRFPGPKTHPSHTVSNCRTERPGIPVAGLPDCQRPGDMPEQYGTTVQTLRDAGLPVPSNYGVPTHGSVQEAPTVHLQVLRIDEILLGGCPCEPITDMTLNFKTRADKAEGNRLDGFNWECRDPDPSADTVECDFRHADFRAPDWRAVPRRAYELMRAQVNNDAAGWEDDATLLYGEADPVDPAEVRGNFTHTELDAEQGFTLPLMVGKANDYVGYVVTYREHQRGDHYRKALTPLGPYSADFINTRLVSMAAELRGGPATPNAVEAAVETVDELLQTGKARVVGAGTAGGTEAYEALLPDDGGTPGHVLAEPAARLERFDAASFTWQGGSNYTDNPRVTVERWVPGVRAAGAPPQGKPAELPPGVAHRRHPGGRRGRRDPRLRELGLLRPHGLARGRQGL